MVVNDVMFSGVLNLPGCNGQKGILVVFFNLFVP